MEESFANWLSVANAAMTLPQRRARAVFINRSLYPDAVRRQLSRNHICSAVEIENTPQLSTTGSTQLTRQFGPPHTQRMLAFGLCTKRPAFDPERKARR